MTDIVTPASVPAPTTGLGMEVSNLTRYSGGVDLVPKVPEVIVAEMGKAEADKPTDWEKRYKDLQAEFTKRTQKPATAEPVVEAPVAAAVEVEAPVVATEEPVTEEPKLDADGKPIVAEEPVEAIVPAEEPESLEAAVAAKVDVPKYETEFAEKGVISEESYAELAEKGFDKGDVDDFIAFRLERNKRFTGAIAEAVGGDEAWAGIKAWSQTGMTEAERNAFNEGMATAASKVDSEGAKLLALGVVQKYQDANGFSASTSAAAGGAGNGGGSGVGFASRADWQAANRSPEYRASAEVRAEVDARLAASGWYKAGL